MQALCSYALMRSPAGQECLLLGADDTNKYLSYLKTFIEYIESAKIERDLNVCIGLQKVQDTAIIFGQPTPPTKELERLINERTSGSITYNWDVRWDEVREFLHRVRADLLRYTLMGVSNEEARAFYKLPASSLSDNTSTKKPWTDVHREYVADLIHLKQVYGKTSWFAMTVPEFVMHLRINYAYLESMARSFQASPLHTQVYAEYVLQPFDKALASIEKIFKSTPEGNTLYEAVMGTLFSSDASEDILKLSAYWTKYFEENTEVLFMVGCVFPRLFQESSKPLCFIVPEIVAEKFASILANGLSMTVVKSSVLVRQAAPIVIATHDDPCFEAELLRATHELIKPLLINKCAQCSKAETLKACGGCKLVQYCSRECQIQDRLSHKVLCKKATIKKETVTS